MAQIVAASDLAFSDGMEKFLLEDIQHSLKMRLFKAARVGWEDSTVQAALRALSSGVDGLEGLAHAVARVDSIYFTIMRGDTLRPRGVERFNVALANFRQARAALLPTKNEQLQELITWIDRDFAERMNCIAVRMGQGVLPAPASAARRVAPKRRMSKPRAAQQVSDDLRRERSKLLYAGFVDSLSDASTAERNSLWRFNDYLSHDDPVWARLTELMDTSGHLPVERDAAGTSLADLVQGVVGEALALRHRAVTEIMHAQFKRAQRLVSQLGSGWEVKVVDSAVWAGTTKSAQLRQLYDGAVMVVNREERITAPVFILSVKSGKSVEAAIQSTSETLREFGQPLTFGAPGPGQGPTFELNNLQSVLATRGVRKTRGDAEELSTYRLLVAPRPPSQSRTAEDLGAHVGVWFMPAILSKREMNDGARALSLGLKRAFEAAKESQAWYSVPR
jgi:hypothetical protein